MSLNKLYKLVLLKPNPLAYLFNILCDKMASMHKGSKYSNCLEKNSHDELWAELALFSWKSILLERMIHKLNHSELGDCDVFLKMNEVSLSLQEKRQMVYCRWKNVSLQMKIRILLRFPSHREADIPPS